MSSHGPREETRRLSIATLAVASMASATAAMIVSQFWQGGTPIAAAVTPVIVAVVSELLRRPTAKIAEKVTVERAALQPRSSDPGPEEARRTMPLEPPAAKGGEKPSPPGDVRVYRSPPPRRRVSPKAVAVTGALAFVIAVAALTVPELIAGRSLVNSDRGTTIFSKKKRSGNGADENRGGEERRQVPADQDDEQPEPERQRQRPEEAEPEPRTTPEETETEPAPRPAPAPEEDTTTDPVPAPAPRSQPPPQ